MGGQFLPKKIKAGERLYIVCSNKLRGYSIITDIRRVDDKRWAFVRRDGAVACTITRRIKGYRYRWWNREDEVPFPGWNIL